MPEHDRRHFVRRRDDARADERRREGGRLLRWWLTAITALFVAVTVQTCAIERNADDIDRQQRAQQAAIVGACLRVNLMRRNDNRVAEAQYQTLTIAAGLMIPPKRGPELARLFAPVAEEQPETAALLKALLAPNPRTERLERRFLALAKRIAYIPVTDCDRATATPSRFEAPASVPIHTLTGEQRKRLRQEGST